MVTFLNTYRYHLAIAFVIASVISYFLLTVPQTPYAEAGIIGQNVSSFKELETRFQDLAKEKGGEYAYEVLKRAPLPSNTDLHLLGHTVGDVLYSQVGIDGIALCTQDFRNACSHSIVIGALNEFGGEPALLKIRDACKKAPGGSGAYTMCYHGLGHGIFAFYSYSFPETVELCGKTGTTEYRNREATECVGGAVMELSGGGGHDREAWKVAREKYLNDPVGLCMGPYIPDDTKSQCLTYITPELWRVAGIDLGKPQPELFEKAFAQCDVIPRSEPELRKSCYGGFGKEFVPLALGRDIREIAKFGERETETVEKWCLSAPLKEARIACMEQAVQSLFWGGENDPQITFRFCDLIAAGDTKNACYSELDAAINSYIHDDRKAILCAQLPHESQNLCRA